ncbi:peptidyl-prolyl cis-trans isomerase [Aquabacter spiritensis]|uniref:Parvulin-like PPIase n=1 Tax=Aquabacter spiritensis TaxID=933073 RepID=A0A4R3LSI1_9HYPH|nr:peptidyl-prolyl cis-trans isomerase [Aquabacter spiritensis]TCT01545.1 peptidyl-prolyl cis-trans isomerase D [Aquabacter spiritensis]
MVLQTLRKGASGLVAKAFLLVLTLSFVIWGISDVFRGYGTSAVAKVGDTEIPVAAFRQQYLDQIQRISRSTGRPITPDQARAFGLDRQILSQMIAEAALDDDAKRRGLALSDDEIAREIRANPDFRRPGASEFEPAYFEQLLRSNGLTELRFIAMEKQRTLRQEIVESFGGGMVVPRVLSDALHRYQTEQRDIAYVVVTPAAAPALPEPTEDQLKAFYDARKVTFRAPEFRKVALLALTPANLAQWIEVSEADLKAAYESNPARFGTPERRQIQQIVFPDAAAAQAADDKIKAGASFLDIAAARGLGPKDVDLGLVTRADLIDTKIAEAAFTLPDGGTSGPIPGAFGSALVHVAAIQPGQQQPFDQVRDQLRQEIALERARRDLLDKHDAIEDERAAGSTLAEVAQKLGLAIDTLEAVDRSGRDPTGAELTDIPGRQDVVSGAFATQPGIEADVIQLPQNGGYVWFDVLEVTPSRERPFDEVKDLVKARWSEDETVKVVDAAAKSLLEAAQAGKSLADLAAAAKLDVKTADGLQRGRASADFSGDALNQIFEVKVGGVGSAPGATPTERLVFQVTKVTLPPAGPSDQELDQQIARQMETDLLLQYVAGLRTELGVEINERSFQTAIGGEQ